MNPKKRYAPAAGRNAEPIMNTIADFLPTAGTVLELASGTGQHCVQFADRFKSLTWQPSDVDPANLLSIDAYVADSGATNLKPSLRIDAAELTWPCDSVSAIIAVNLVHIAPWSVAEGVFRSGARHLGTDGCLILYGPYRFFGHYNAVSNKTFHFSLKDQNEQWGVRDLEDLAKLAASNGLHLDALIPMPANNHLLVFRKVSMLEGC